WDARSGRNVALVGGETGGVPASTVDVALSPDGRLVASISSRAVLRVWDVASEKKRLQVNAHSGIGTSVALSPDGTTIATASGDGTFRVYLLGVDEIDRIARSRLTRSLTAAECLQYLHTATCPPSPEPSGGRTPGHATAPSTIGPEGAFRV